jgi:hypothetical protein
MVHCSVDKQELALNAGTYVSSEWRREDYLSSDDP